MKKRLIDFNEEDFLKIIKPQFEDVICHIKSSNSIIEERLKALEKPSKTELPEGDAWLVIEDVARMTNRSIHTIRGYVQRGEIPYQKKGSLLEFRKSEIIKWWNQKASK